MSYVSRWKDTAPQNTIRKIKGYLKENDIQVKEVNKTNSKGCYALTLILKDTNLFVNGKGSSEEFAMASAYGELMERISTLVLFRYNYRNLNIKENEPVFLKEEVFFTKEDYYNNNTLNRVSDYDISYEEALNVQGYFTNFNKALVMEELKQLGTGKKKYFPMSITDILYGTNGMSYGNTLSEAKVQALAEIFERYANREIIKRRMTPPIINNIEDILDPRLYSLIKGFQSEELSFQIMDASIGQELPVVCVLFQHIPTGKYYVKFGSHFDINIAVERCFTELFQGREITDLSFLKEKIYVDDIEWQEKNLESILHNGEGYYPLEFFKKGEQSYPPKRWNTISSNDEGVQILENLLQRLSQNIYLKDYSHDGHFIVRYLAEGISEIHIMIQQKITWQIDLIKNAEKLCHYYNLCTQDMKAVIDFIENNSSGDDGTLIPYFRHPLKYSGKYCFLNLILLRFILAVKEKDHDKAVLELERYLNCKNKNERIELAMNDILHLMDQSLSPEAYESLVEAIPVKSFKLHEMESKDFCEKGECHCNAIASAYKKIKGIL